MFRKNNLMIIIKLLLYYFSFSISTNPKRKTLSSNSNHLKPNSNFQTSLVFPMGQTTLAKELLISILSFLDLSQTNDVLSTCQSLHHDPTFLKIFMSQLNLWDMAFSEFLSMLQIQIKTKQFTILCLM